MSIFGSVTDVFFGSTSKSALAGVRVDAMMSERIVLNSQISQYPRENGMPFTDGIIPALRTLELEGVVTTANVIFLDGFISAGAFLPTGDSKLVAARKQLELVHKTRQPVLLMTSGIVYQNYGMATCSIDRRGDGMDGELRISATFIEMPTVSLQTTTVSVASKVSPIVKGKAGATKAVAGAVGGTTTTPAATVNPSAALSLMKALKGLL